MATLPTIPRDTGDVREWIPTKRGRTRGDTIIGRLVDAGVRNWPRIRAGLVKARRAVLTVAGVGLISAAAWTVAVPLGLAAAGVSLLVLEYLTAPSGE
jgi:hypothetical protein